MRRKALALCILLFLTACRASPGPEEGVKLYFASTRDSGASLVALPYRGEEASPSVDALLSALLAGPPENENAASPFPRGLSVLSWELRADGVLSLDLSEHYSGLSDVSLTLADYCIVLTLGQLESVEQVEITVAGRPLSYRSHQVLAPEEVLSYTELAD